MSSENVYVATFDRLAAYISSFVLEYPEILTMDEPGELFKIKDFDCSDINPSLAQAQIALRTVQKEHNVI